MKLRNYQIEAVHHTIRNLKKQKMALIRMPAGSGKTVLMAQIVMEMAKERSSFSACFVAPERILIAQLEADVNFYLSTFDTSISISFYTRQTLASLIKGNKLTQKFDLMCCDEFHKGTSDQRDHLEYETILNSKIYAKVLGVSATIIDLDRKLVPQEALATMYHLSYKAALDSKVINDIKLIQVATGLDSTIKDTRDNSVLNIQGHTIEDTAEKFNAVGKTRFLHDEVIKFNLAKRGILLDVFFAKEVVNGRVPKTLVYGASVTSEENPLSLMSIQKYINNESRKRGLLGAAGGSPIVRTLDGNDKNNRTLKVVNDFKNMSGGVDILIVCNMLSVGFNFPELEVCVDFRWSPSNVRDSIQRLYRIGRVKKNKPASRHYSSISVVESFSGMTLSDGMFAALANQPSFRNANTSVQAVEKSSILQNVVGLHREEAPDIKVTMVGEEFQHSSRVAKDIEPFTDLFKELGEPKKRKSSILVITHLYTDKVQDTAVGQEDAMIRVSVNFKDAITSARTAVDVRKKALLDMANKGEDKPVRPHPLTYVFYSYTKKNSPYYDENLTSELKRISPKWFKHEWNKHLLLEYATDLNLDDNTLTRVLRITELSRYTKLSSIEFDSTFDRKIRKLRPDWFAPNSWTEMDLYYNLEITKQKLIHRAKQCKSIPTGRLGDAFSLYTMRGGGFYDTELTKKLQKLMPYWFMDDYAMKKWFLRLAKAGGDKPRPDLHNPETHKHYLGCLYLSYIQRGKYYDSNFRADIKCYRSDWLKP